MSHKSSCCTLIACYARRGGVLQANQPLKSSDKLLLAGLAMQHSNTPCGTHAHLLAFSLRNSTPQRRDQRLAGSRAKSNNTRTSKADSPSVPCTRYASLDLQHIASIIVRAARTLLTENSERCGAEQMESRKPLSWATNVVHGADKQKSGCRVNTLARLGCRALPSRLR